MKQQLRVLAISGIFFLLSGCQSSPRPQAPPPKVATATVKQSDIPLYIDTIGQAVSPVVVNIRPQVSGKLVSVYVKEGGVVEQGDLLYSIDPRPYQAILDQASAKLEYDLTLSKYADQVVERYKTIVEEDFISVLTYEEYVSNAQAAKALLEQDRAAVRAAEINLAFCQIQAPVSGKISYFNVDVGNVVVIDDPNALTVIRPSTPIYVSFSLPQHYFEKIREEQGDEGHWKFAAYLPEHPEEIFTGTTFFMDNQINPNTGTILLKGEFDNRKKEIWPGAFLKVKVLYKVALQAFSLPPGGILIGKSGPYVYAVNGEQKAETHQVSVLMRADEYVAFTSSTLQQGDTVIIDGQINVAPGVVVDAAPLEK